MIKPILYHNIEEKNRIEAELMAKVPKKELEARSKALMLIFARLGHSIKRKRKTVQRPVSKKR